MRGLHHLPYSHSVAWRTHTRPKRNLRNDVQSIAMCATLVARHQTGRTTTGATTMNTTEIPTCPINSTEETTITFTDVEMRNEEWGVFTATLGESTWTERMPVRTSSVFLTYMRLQSKKTGIYGIVCSAHKTVAAAEAEIANVQNLTRYASAFHIHTI
jgi:hypothetical protein